MSKIVADTAWDRAPPDVKDFMAMHREKFRGKLSAMQQREQEHRDWFALMERFGFAGLPLKKLR